MIVDWINATTLGMLQIRNFSAREYMTILSSGAYYKTIEMLEKAIQGGGEMRFLIISKAKILPPPEMTPTLVNAVGEWAKKYKANGKLEQAWGFAGLQGGGGIANVNSLEDLDELMVNFPTAPFSDTNIYGLIDFEISEEHQRQAMAAMGLSK